MTVNSSSMEFDLIATYVQFGREEKNIDFYVSTFGMGTLVIFGLFGNCFTYFTLSNVRMAFSTCTYYKLIAVSDFGLCLTLFTYILRTWLPFRSSYFSTFFEAYMMYSILDIFQFISLCSATVLCLKLCYGIFQSRKLKRSATNPSMTKMLLTIVVVCAFLFSLSRCFEKEMVKAELTFHTINCTNSNENNIICEFLSRDTYEIRDRQMDGLSKIFIKLYTVIPQLVLLVVILFLSVLLLIWLCIMKVGHNFLWPKSRIRKSSKVLRNQRRICHLFLLLSFCYTVSLLPYLIGQTIELIRDDINRSNVENSTANYNCDYEDLEKYNSCMKANQRLILYYSFTNVIQNIGHAITFYVYVVFCRPFRKQFVVTCFKLKNWLKQKRIFQLFRLAKTHSIESSGTLSLSPPLPNQSFLNSSSPKIDHDVTAQNHIHMFAAQIPGQKIRRWGFNENRKACMLFNYEL